MKKKRIYYSIVNGGDGSAYPEFFYSREAAELHQDMQEGWGEPCWGYLDYEGSAKFEDVKTDREYAQELADEYLPEDYEYYEETIRVAVRKFIEENMGE